jgi:hypothetical protein
MSIKVGVTLSALQDARTANAVRDLIEALAEFLGGAEPAVVATPAAPAQAYAAAAAPAEPAYLPPAPAAPAAPAYTAPVVAAPPAAKPAPEVVTAPAAKPAPAPAAKPEAAPAPAPVVAAATDAEPSLGDRYHAFVRNLPPRSQEFLKLVEERGTVTISEVMRALGLHLPKAMGGITGSIGRWAPVKRVPLPYEQLEKDGERAWRWVGIAGVTRGAHVPPPKPKSAPAIVAAPVAPAPEPKVEPKVEPKARKAAPVAPPAPVIVSTSKEDRFIAALPDNSRQFMARLQEEHKLLMADALKMFSLNRPKALGGILEPIKRIARDHGVEVPFEVATDGEGNRVWYWPGHAPVAAPAAAAETPKSPPPGVLRRKKG